MSLVFQHHGKSSVRVGRVWRDGDKHTFVEWKVHTMLESDMEHAYVQGSNEGMTATDTQKNTVYYIAKQFSEPCAPEEFAVALAKHFVNTYEKVSKAKITVEQLPWERHEADSQPHNHGYAMKGTEIRTTHVIYDDDGDLEVKSGVKELRVLKTTQSSYVGYIQDELTSLPETHDRIMASAVTAQWKYSEPVDDFDDVFKTVKECLLSAFFGPPDKGVASPSVQFTLFQMGKAVLDKVPSVEDVFLNMPNLHFLPCTPLTSKFEDDVYVATSEPHGNIEATVSR